MTALGTRLLKIKIGDTEFTAQVSKCVITSGPADADFVTFADAAAGGKREYALEFEAVQDTDTTALWDKCWSAAGTSVAVVFNPYGVGTATATNPFFTGNVTITEPDGDLIGGEANKSTLARMTFSCKWVFDAKPVKVTTGAF
ncbi:hypothetical protein [Nocardioides sp.]|uniref:hypothetical protein n=1 Tax=Nocardioides sp. TaxID=35761 RepID=UPI002B670959|nr:hypothetical protein [Nocardioides sp.]HSX66671.1 hypothetical protein [Nocardioides sp.]